MSKTIGILTAGGDSPGLNAAIRGVGKAAIQQHDMNVIGFRDGFRGLIENRTVRLTGGELSGILTLGGTMLGTSRDKPHKMSVGNKVMDMTEVVVEHYHRHHLECLVCIGGGGTQKNAYRLSQAGLNVITLPKTIDNDVWGTDSTFGFDTALGIATEAIDRLHSTAHSHHRIIVVEVMGHNTGWLALGAGLAGGADVILIPEIPYDVEVVAESIRARSRNGSRFSIVALSEGAMSIEQAKKLNEASEALSNAKAMAGGDKSSDKKASSAKKAAKADLEAVEKSRSGNTLRLSDKLEELTGLESRVTILGHVQRGGTPSAADRILTTQLGTACARLADEGTFGVLVALKNGDTIPVPLEEIVGRRKVVPEGHAWITAARNVGVCLGDQ